MKFLKSIGLILGSVAVFVVGGLLAIFVTWAVVLSLFLYSRLSERAEYFANWSWPHFLMTIGLGLSVPYLILLFTAGF